ncbi:hypothetical protein EGW08_004285 [Elysia chlorotica]|uniref:Protein kinase domain-containing protein n=1 Tax=Elysia chlorotica TaxID=188477 RepID=A0A433U2G0_ELYCH|nr:hypothetical protein EGW08_004285 [Elysia chlorotica]
MENYCSRQLCVSEPEVVHLDGDFFSTFQFEEGPALGHGLSGVVVEATSLTNPLAKVAVKKFSLLGSDGGLKKSETFIKEVSVMQSFQHPHIVPCVFYLLQTGHALAQLHAARIAHGDVKLDNVFLMHAHHAVLGDFGLAVRLPELSMGLVPASQCGGTPSYMAPEARDAAAGSLVDPVKLDVYVRLSEYTNTTPLVSLHFLTTVITIAFQLDVYLDVYVRLSEYTNTTPASWTYDYLEETNTDPDIPDIFRCVAFG